MPFIGALQADLPALRPAELARVLQAAEEFEQAFVPRRARRGHDLLHGTPFTPRFGGEPRAKHPRATNVPKLSNLGSLHRTRVIHATVMLMS
ncbi:hypothetical protein ACIBKY_53560 [Nonomuraea sp. NPDC050394]|uniref:hypothetical protein n=1 Tax=Nonomuraea sp. NPDC050394 TaxID=3364363 RepID=UPI0037B4E298